MPLLMLKLLFVITSLSLQAKYSPLYTTPTPIAEDSLTTHKLHSANIAKEDSNAKLNLANFYCASDSGQKK